jgi:integrase
MDAYLTYRSDSKSAVYHIQYPIPRDVQERRGKRYERKSCRTADLRDARRIAASLIAGWERDYQRIRLEAVAASIQPSEDVPISDALIGQICDRWHASALKSDDEERDELGDIAEEEAGSREQAAEELATYLRSLEVDARQVAAQGKAAPSYPIIVSAVLEFADSIGYSFMPSDSLLPKLAKQFAATQVQVAKDLNNRNSGNFVDTPAVPASFAGLSVLEYLPEWERLHVQGLKPRTINSYKTRITQFQQYCVNEYPELKDTSFRAIERKHVQAFVNHLMHEKKLHPNTIQDGYLAALSSICKYAVADGHVDRDPTDGVVLSKLPKHVIKTMSRPRHPFQVEFVNKLFKSDWYCKAKDVGSSPITADWSVRYWFPLIELCHGFRPSEIIQMETATIFADAGVLAFHVQEGKTEATKRCVSVHKVLIDLGFGEWVAQRKRSRDKLLFQVFSKYERNDDVFTQRFNYFIRQKLKAPKEYTTSSFRHLWEDMRRAAIAKYGKEAWPRGMSFQLSGREDIDKEEGSSKFYGNGYDAKTMRPYLDSVWFEDIQLPKPYGG